MVPRRPTSCCLMTAARMDMWSATSPQDRSVDLNNEQFSRFALMFANVRKDLGETLTSDGDARVWVVTITKAAGPNIMQ